ncbi:MAG: type IV toxin-antitoxin system AbiEi family antitoxin [Candidatus Aminicenantales bacterium]
MKREKVGLLVDQLQSRGQYSFSIKDVLAKADQPSRTVRRSLERLQQKGRISLITRGFYTIIPLEYKESGVLPAEWFIHQLMDYLKLPYYIGLLSAAALHGSAHQRPQEFQVIISQQRRPLRIDGLRIRFFSKKKLDLSSGIAQIKAETGYLLVSGPELTAIDLLKYSNSVGGLNSLATVIAELGEGINADELLKVARKTKNLVFLQRLGYLLDHLGFESKTGGLVRWLSGQKTYPVLLDPAQKKGKSLFNKKWKLSENQKVEAELL